MADTIEDLYRSTPRQMRRHVAKVLRKGRVPFVQSSPGLGKSAIIRAIGDEFNLHNIDHRLATSAPEDLSGLPNFENGMARFFPFADLFPIEGITEIPDGKDGWNIFLDEFNHADKAVQAAAYKLILDRMIGQFRLHSRCVVSAAGNMKTDKAFTNDLSTAMQSRVIHIFMQFSHPEWMEDVLLAQKYDERLIAFHSFDKNAAMDFDPDHNNATFCCPRTWEFMNDLIKDEEIVDDDIPLFAGTITPGKAVSFVQFCKVYEDLIRIEHVLRSPTGCGIPKDRASAFATVTHLGQNINEKNFGDVATYVNRLELEFQVVFFRSVMVQHPELRRDPAYARAMLVLKDYLYEDGRAYAPSAN